MDEKNENELKKVDELHRTQGGESLQNDSRQDVQAVYEGRKTADQVERIMSQEEIISEARLNGLYKNMLAPCLAANIALDGKILEYFKDPMNPEDLDDKIKLVMQVLLHEISSEQNGLVFSADGTIDSHASLMQSIGNGLPINPLLVETISDENLQKITEDGLKKTAIGMKMWAVAEKASFDEESVEKVLLKGVEKKEIIKFETILGQSISNARERYDEEKLCDEHKKVFEHEYSDEEKNEIDAQIRDLDLKIDEISGQIAPIREKIKTLPKDSKEYVEAIQEITELSIQRKNALNAKWALGKTEPESCIEKKAEINTAKIGIARLLGVKKDDIEGVYNDTKSLNNKSKLAREASRHELCSHRVQDYYLNKMMQVDVKDMRDFRESFIAGRLSEDSKKDYLAISIKNYIVYSVMNENNGLDSVTKEAISVNIQEALRGIVTCIPNVKDGDELNWNKIVESLNGIPGFEKVTKDTVKDIMVKQKFNQIDEELDAIAHAGELLEEKQNDEEIRKYLEDIKEEDKILEACKFINYARRLEEKGMGGSTSKICAMKLKRDGLEHLLDRADEMYEESKAYIDEIMNNYKKNEALAKFDRFNSYTEKGLSMLTNEESGSILTTMIAAYEVSKDNSNISKEVQDAARVVFRAFLGDVFDKDGRVDEDKLVAAYKEKYPEGKYAFPKSTDDKKEFFAFHESMTLSKVQKNILPTFFDVIKGKEKEINDLFLTDRETQKVVDEKGETIDVSAITNPMKAEDKVAKITDEEAKNAVDRNGENITIADTTIQEHSQDEHLQDGRKVTQELNVEDITIGGNENFPAKSNKFLAFLGGIKNGVKAAVDKVKSIFSSESNSGNNSESNSASSSGGNVVSNKTEQVVKSDNLVQQVVIDVKKAQQDAKTTTKEETSKEKISEEDMVLE